ncbi:MAG: hypothetical protein KVP17_000236 [Porospora cf. gigantea B]|uniref:uncharacterized protein n=1 Tax=Porospora cf. gigantea B TaxID=2853592 RepID=UPI0035717C43|nr:MAG: hypothetical protein KVP17_000236 [Porospora cf. gigantea B]
MSLTHLRKSLGTEEVRVLERPVVRGLSPSATELKNQAAEEFRNGAWHEAARLYELAADATDEADGVEQGDAESDMLSVLYSNVSLCHIKTADYEDGLVAAAVAALRNPNNTKALYRHALCARYTSRLVDAALSLQLLQQAKERSPAVGLLHGEVTALLREEKGNRVHAALPDNLITTLSDAAASVEAVALAVDQLRLWVVNRQVLDRAVHDGVLQAVLDRLVAVESDINGDCTTSLTDVEWLALQTAACRFVLACVVDEQDVGDLSLTDSERAELHKDQLRAFDQVPTVSKSKQLAREAVAGHKNMLLTLAKAYTGSDVCIVNRERDPSFTRDRTSSAKALRSMGAVLLQDIVSYVGDLADPETLAIVEKGLSCIQSETVAKSAVVSLGRLADLKRRLGRSVQAVVASHALIVTLESCLHLVPLFPELHKLAEFALVSVFVLFADKERSDEYSLDMHATMVRLLDPYLSEAQSDADWYIGLQGLNYLWRADRQCVKEFLIFGKLLSPVLMLASEKNSQEPRMQRLAAEILMHAMEFAEVREEILMYDGINLLVDMCLLNKYDTELKAQLAASLARLSIHNEKIRKAVFQEFQFFTLTAEVLRSVSRTADDDIGARTAAHVLEVLFFLSLHEDFKVTLFQGVTSPGQDEIVATSEIRQLLKAGLVVDQVPLLGRAALVHHDGSSQYLYAAVIYNICRSRDDKDRVKRQKNMPMWDDEQLEAAQLMFEKLPEHAKPVQNGIFDRGDESLVDKLRQVLVEKKVVEILAGGILQKDTPPGIALVTLSCHAIRMLVRSKETRNLVCQQVSASQTLTLFCFRTVFRRCCADWRYSSRSSRSTLLLRTIFGGMNMSSTIIICSREIRQAVAQILLVSNCSLFSYRAQLESTTHMLALLEDKHELFNFEGAMALTNLSSQSEEVRRRMFHTGAVATLGQCLMDTDNELLRAALLEVSCNLALCQLVIDAFAEGKCKFELHVLLAFLKEDNNTRAQSAAAGCLAMLTADIRIGLAVLRDEFGANVFHVIEAGCARKDEPLLRRGRALLSHVLEASQHEVSPYKDAMAPQSQLFDTCLRGLEKGWDCFQDPQIAGAYKYTKLAVAQASCMS